MYNGRWSLQITSSNNHTKDLNIRGWEGSYGTISDWVLVVTDYAGIVKVYYQDIRAEITSLPKYGKLLSTTSYTSNGYGEWSEIMQLKELNEIQTSPELSRYLSPCYGVDTTGLNGVRSGINTYRYCSDNYGVGNVLNNRRDGDYPIPSQFIRNERVVFYVPNSKYLGPDYFTYRIYDEQSIQKNILNKIENEVTIHVRNCRDNQNDKINNYLHPLCSCSSNSNYLIENYVDCHKNIQLVCSDTLTSDVFSNLCEVCETWYKTSINNNSTNSSSSSSSYVSSTYSINTTLSIIPSSKCVSEIIRAVSFTVESKLCSTDPSYYCYDEIFTDPGKEIYNYLSLETFDLYYPFIRPREYTQDYVYN